MSPSQTDKSAADNSAASKWGKLIGFGTGRKRLIIAGLALTAILIVFVVVIATSAPRKNGKVRRQ